MKYAALILLCAVALAKTEDGLYSNGCPKDWSIEQLFPHPDCHKFYQCWDGQLVVHSCPSDLYFSIEANRCEWSKVVDCADRNVPEKESNEVDDSQDDSGAGAGNCDPSQAPEICAAEDSAGVLVAHEKCNKFYICENGLPLAISCPANLLFNPKTDTCDWAENVDCGDRITSDGDNGGCDGNCDNDSDDGADDNGNAGAGNCDPSQAPEICAAEGSDSVLVAHEKCNKYYICVHGKPVPFRCPGNLLFNPQSDTCDWPENVNCGDRVIPDGENGGNGNEDSGNDNNGSNDNSSSDSESNENNGNDNNGSNDNSSSDSESNESNGNDNNGSNDNSSSNSESNENDGNDSGDGENGNVGAGNCDPSQAPEICAADDSDSILVAHEKCNKFYICNGGRPTALSCPGNLLFNPKTDTCDWPENVDCGDRVIPDGESGGNGNEESGNDNGGHDNNGSNESGSDNGGNDNGNGNVGAGNCDPSQAPAICAADDSDSILVAHEKCNKFYICNGGSPVAVRCPANLLFNPQTDTCDWPENVDCGDRVIPDGESSGNGNDNGGSDNGGSDNGGSDNGGSNNGGNGNGNENVGAGNCDPSQAPAICAAEDSDGILVAHEKCNKFYICNGGRPVALGCPGNLLFNPNTDTCDWPENVDCGDRVIPDGDSNNGGSDNGGSDNGGSDNGGNDNGNGNVGAGNCDPSQAPAICAAEDSDGILVAHEKCNKFYICNGGSPAALSCPGNLLFNPNTDTCDWPENVDCGDRVIPDGESGGNGNDNGGSDNGGSDNGGSNNGGNDNGNENVGAGNCDPSQAPAICAAEDSDSILVAHEKCNKFYICNGGRPTALSCPGNLLFNPKTDSCDWPENVDCGDRVIPDGESGGNGNEESGNDNGGHDNNGSNENGSDNGGNDNGNDNVGAGNCDPSQAPAICAADDSDSILVAHEKCNKFYICNGGSPVAVRCPANLLFNPQTDTCDWPENVDCGDRVIPDGESGGNGNDNGGSDNGGSDNGGSDNGGSDNGGSDNGVSDNGNENVGAGNCDPSQAPAICAAEDSDGILVAHEKCNKFYICNGGSPVALGCPGNLLFNPNTDTCDWPENVDCGDRVISDGDSNNGGSDNGGSDNGGSDNGGNDNGNGNVGAGNCDPSQAPAICAAEDSDGILVAHEKCNKFYICNGGSPVALSCPGNLLFNPNTDTCDWPENVDCGDRVIPDGDSHNGGSDNGGSDNGGSDNGGSDNGGNDNGNGNVGAGNCDPSQAPAICAAEDSDGVLVAHEKCNKFYICDGGSPVALRCPGNLLFNPNTDTCDWPENVDCGDRVIPDGDNDNGGIDNGGSHNGGSDNGGNDNGGSDNGGSDNGGNDNGNGNVGAGNCDPSQAPAICAAEDSNGVLVAHEKCNKFNICNGGSPVALSCPGNLLFNPNTDTCDWPENVDCGDRIIPNGESGGNGNEESGNNNGGNNNNESNENGSENGGNDNGNSNVGAGNCDPSQAPAICAAEDSNGILVAHEKCNKFYICHGGSPAALSCPGNLLFNPNTDTCDWPENVDCGDRVIPGGESGGNDNEGGSSDNGGSDNGDAGNDSNDSGNNGPCNCNPNEAPEICAAEDSDGVLIAHDNCNKFYVCGQGKPFPISCPSGLLYNPHKGVCDWPENVECGDRVIPDGESGNGNEESGNDNGGNNNGDSNNGGNDNGGNDNGNDNVGAGNCDPSQAPAICAADDSERVLVAHEKCNKFYVCNGGNPVTLRCPGNLLFNPKTDTCDWPENVDCGDRVIPNGESGGNDNEGGSNDNGGSDNGDAGNDSNDSGNNGPCNCNPNEAPEICAAEDSDGVLIAHDNCNTFYVCGQGKPFPISCPSGLLYNPHKGVCDWPENVDCGDRVIPDGESGNGNEESGNDNGGNDNGDSNNGGNDNGDSNNGGNDNGGNDNGNDNVGAGNCDPSQAPAICAADESEGVLVAHEKCNKFYVCNGGNPVTLRCPGNLLFNPKTDTCDWPENVDCGDRVIPDGESGGNDNEGGSNNNGGNDNGDAGNDSNDSGNNGPCNCNPNEAPEICAVEDSDGVLIAHNKCNEFYVCGGGKPFALPCPSGLLYNPHKGVCDWPENVDCGDRIIGGDENNDSGNNENGGNDNDNNGSCNCNPGQAPAICAADGSDGVLIAHEICNNFYVCGNTKPVSFRCPVNLVYNPYTETCDWAENVDCNGREEAGSEDSANDINGDGNVGAGNHDPSLAPIICADEKAEGVLVAHEECDKFYTCGNGEPVTLRCPANLFFNPSADQCDWPSNVNCGERTIPSGFEASFNKHLVARRALIRSL
ncbi:uncharacterized protein LOC135079394 [Ostrinia nubilalis]|uniref:uncharacterized protein LOC135079394 n=1 Tax=Ostrinia nubilalis TaxID=29057 RepID=UPI00308232C4